MLSCASFGNSGLSNVERAGSWHTRHVDAESNSNVKKLDGMSVFVKEDVGALICNTAGNFDGQRDGRLGDVVDSVSRELVVLLCRLL